MKYLVTTSNKKTWPKSGDIVFLGEWCKDFKDERLLESIDSETLDYHWNDREKLHQDYLYLIKIHEEILKVLSMELNKLHNANHSIEYWRMIVGVWLGEFVQIVFDRWFMLKEAVNIDTVNAHIVDIGNTTPMVPNDMREFKAISIENDWNEALFEDLIKRCWPNKLNMHNSAQRIQAATKRDAYYVGHEHAVKRLIFKIYDFFSKFNSENDKYFFIFSYLPLKPLLKLQIILGQFPKMWRMVPSVNAKNKVRKRNWTINCRDSHDDFLKLISQMIPDQIPAIYIEGYFDQKKLVENLSWPKKPSVIFTAVSWMDDDVFKFWAAIKKNQGASLVIAQHGGSFGMAKTSFYEDHQLSISDYFLSWGWKRGGMNTLPWNNIKLVEDVFQYNPKGKALMAEMIIPKYSFHLTSSPISRGQWLDYFRDQCDFIKEFPEAMQRQLIVRLFSNVKERKTRGVGCEERWLSQNFNVEYDFGEYPFSEALSRSRIVISTYNATVYLESLSRNIPTLIFWNKNHWELRNGVVKYFDLLESAGIFFGDPKAAAQQLCRIWDDIPAWWNSKEVQDARLKFCKNFSNTSKDSLKELQGILTEIKDK
jgi:putative transferase (TIGR04331 family)